MRKQIQTSKYSEVERGFGRKHDITIEEVKACNAFANFSDIEVLEIIETIKSFTTIVHDCYQRKKLYLKR
ncbi:hypothetical protein [Anditalea andensis]|uniref:Uncharacterized protein n=1 Tax=Anditalea andensis TaxID=1048983 RepID=A0A074KZM5_9BACT|nr:hypothetical protein [Anditalea andensis]KEO75451.1 hypothetical protein EL17_00930 [Anditalea andensis]